MYENNCFITLTYDETKENYHNNMDYSDIQKFKKSLRRKLEPKKIEIFNVHEYGKNGKKHWHLVIFNHDFKDKEYLYTKNGNPIYQSNELAKIWKHGHNTVGSVTEASAMYQAQYTQKDIKNGNTNNKKKAKSNHSGIGLPYFMRHYRQILSLGYVPFGDKRVPIPRSFIRRAHKHYCHYYDQSYFFHTVDRKRWYTPFNNGDALKDLADLYIYYRDNIKQPHIKQLEEEWNETIAKHLETEEKPNFIKSAENFMYDLQNKNNAEQF